MQLRQNRRQAPTARTLRTAARQAQKRKARRKRPANRRRSKLNRRPAPLVVNHRHRMTRRHPTLPFRQRLTRMTMNPIGSNQCMLSFLALTWHLVGSSLYQCTGFFGGAKWYSVLHSVLNAVLVLKEGVL